MENHSENRQQNVNHRISLKKQKSHQTKVQKYHEFHDEENPYSQSYVESPQGKSLKKQITRVIVEPIEKSKLYKLTKKEIEYQNKKSFTEKFQTISTVACCIYWIMNSTLGFYLVYNYPKLAETHPNIYKYLLYFSSKWLLACFMSLMLQFLMCLILQICCCVNKACQNTLGLFPITYLLIIFISYMYSLYYGIIILREIYDPSSKEEQADYEVIEGWELWCLKVFVLNEIVVGTIIALQLMAILFCGKITKSKHLNEIEGEGFGVDENEVKQIQKELQESRMRTESLRKDTKKNKSSLPNLQIEMIQEIRQTDQNVGATSFISQPLASQRLNNDDDFLKVTNQYK